MTRTRWLFLLLFVVPLAREGMPVLRQQAQHWLHPPATARTDAAAAADTFVALTYNVAGLPDVFSAVEPSRTIPQIAPRLNAYDLVLVQEDFAFHHVLARDAAHPYRSAPRPGSLLFGDGLSQFSRFPFAPVTRVTWSACSGIVGGLNDCLADKGFTVTRVRLAAGAELDVYNHHQDAGNDRDDNAAKATNIEQFLEFVQRFSGDRAVLVAGDTNLDGRDPAQANLLERWLRGAGLSDACALRACTRELLDRVFVRSGRNLALEVLDWFRPAEFVQRDGRPLSDHEPVAVRIRWARRDS